MRYWKPLALALAAPSLLWAAQPNVPSVELLAAYPAMASFTVSPDGKHLAAIEARGEDRVILVWDTANLQGKPAVIGTQKMKFQQVSFIKNDLLAVSLWQPIDLHATRTIRTFTAKFFFTDLQGKNWREPLPQVARSEVDELEQAATSPGLLDPLVNDPTHVLLVVGSGTNQGDIYRVDVTNGRSERIQRAEEHVGEYGTDLNGQVRARAQLDTDTRGAYVALELRNPDTGAWEEHFRTYAKDRDIIEVAGFATDGNTAYLRSNIGRDKAVIQEYDVRARKLGEVVFENKFFDASSIQLHRVKDAQFGEIDSFGFFGVTETDRYYAAPWLQALDKQLTAAFAIKDEPQQVIDIATGKSATAPMRTGRRWSLVSASQDRSIMVVSVESTTEPPDFYLLRGNKLTLLARTWPAIDPTSLGTGKLVYYKARDGLDIPAYLHTPSTALCGAGPWPSVVLPHGGPWARDGLGFDRSMWVPLLTSRCRAVLQPQYRGSADWGRYLWLAGDREWGQKMQDDKDDGARWLLDQKIAIPGRIAMFGFSYGGYAAFAAAVRPNGLYKCSIAGAGVSDINKIWARFYTNAYFRDHQAPTVKGLNPLDKADEIQIPIYVFHGDRDQTVPIRQSEMFVDKAKGAKRDVTYREFKDFDHGPSWLRSTYADVLRGIDDYLTKGCGGGL
jgi:dipeptidyl aminopeptidase/acylaminoacyl peptidase